MPNPNEEVVLGVQRSSMRKNYLLQKPQLEKPTNWCREIPGYGHVYGTSYAKIGGVADALSGWVTNPYEHDQPKRFRRKKRKDFIGMNRAAASVGLLNAKDQQKIRDHHPMLRKDTGERFLDKKFPPPDIIFGKRYPPSTPMAKVMGMHYQKEFICGKVMKDLRRKHIRRGKFSVLGQTLPTKASKMAAYKPPSTPELVRPNAKYEQLTSATESFRSEDARQASLARQLALEKARLADKSDRMQRARIKDRLMDMPVEERLTAVLHVPLFRRSYSLYTVNPVTGVRRLNEPTEKDIVLRPSLYLTRKKSSSIGVEKEDGGSDSKETLMPWKPPYA